MSIRVHFSGLSVYFFTGGQHTFSNTTKGLTIFFGLVGALNFSGNTLVAILAAISANLQPDCNSSRYLGFCNDFPQECLMCKDFVQTRFDYLLLIRNGGPTVTLSNIFSPMFLVRLAISYETHWRRMCYICCCIERICGNGNNVQCYALCLRETS